MKRTLALSLLAFALLALPGSAGDLPGTAPLVTAEAPPADAPPTDVAPPAEQPELQPALGVPAPRLMSLCTDTCYSDFKICRNSCHSLACYNSCRAALDVCVEDCQS